MQRLDARAVAFAGDEDAMRNDFERLKAAAAGEPFPSWPVRKRRLDSLFRLLHDNEARLCEAISADFGHRSWHETQLLELFPSLEAVRHALRHGAAWMRDERRAMTASGCSGAAWLVEERGLGWRFGGGRWWPNWLGEGAGAGGDGEAVDQVIHRVATVTFYPAEGGLAFEYQYREASFGEISGGYEAVVTTTNNHDIRFGVRGWHRSNLSTRSNG